MATLFVATMTTVLLTTGVSRHQASPGNAAAPEKRSGHSFLWLPCRFCPKKTHRAATVFLPVQCMQGAMMGSVSSFASCMGLVRLEKLAKH